MWAIPAVKMSVGFFLLRIAPSKFYRRLLQGTMAFLMAYTLVCFLTLLLQCTNIAVLWDLGVRATCWPQATLQALSYANSVVNIVTDFFFAALPVPMLWNVQINARTKASLVGIMGLGVLSVGAAAPPHRQPQACLPVLTPCLPVRVRRPWSSRPSSPTTESRAISSGTRPT